jgi:hypothetical protein
VRWAIEIFGNLPEHSYRSIRRGKSFGRMTGNWRFRPWYRALRAEIDAETIGRPIRRRLAHHDPRASRPDGFADQPDFAGMPRLILLAHESSGPIPSRQWTLSGRPTARPKRGTANSSECARREPSRSGGPGVFLEKMGFRATQKLIRIGLLGLPQPHAPVAQLDRASVYGTEGYRFESYRVYFTQLQSVLGVSVSFPRLDRRPLRS